MEPRRCSRRRHRAVRRTEEGQPTAATPVERQPGQRHVAPPWSFPFAARQPTSHDTGADAELHELADERKTVLRGHQSHPRFDVAGHAHTETRADGSNGNLGRLSVADDRKPAENVRTSTNRASAGQAHHGGDSAWRLDPPDGPTTARTDISAVFLLLTTENRPRSLPTSEAGPGPRRPVGQLGRGFANQ